MYWQPIPWQILVRQSRYFVAAAVRRTSMADTQRAAYFTFYARLDRPVLIIDIDDT